MLLIKILFSTGWLLVIISVLTNVILHTNSTREWYDYLIILGGGIVFTAYILLLIKIFNSLVWILTN
jgi:hypothetical protein